MTGGIWAAAATYGASGVLTATLAGFAWRRRSTCAAATEYAAWLVALTLWSVGFTAEMLAGSLAAKLALDSAQYALVPAIVGLEVAFIWRYTGSPRARSRWLGAGVALASSGPVSAILIGTYWFNLRSSAHIVSRGPAPALLYDFTIWDYAAGFLGYGVVVAALARLYRARKQQHPAHRRSTSLLLLAFLLPIPGTLAAFADVTAFGQRDLGPLLFGVVGLITGWGLFRRSLFDIVPVARSVVLDVLPDAVFVIDSRGRIADLNPAAVTLLGGDRELGREAASHIPLWPMIESLAASGRAGSGRHAGRHWEIQAVSLGDAGADAGGIAVAMRDVTVLKNLNEELERRVGERTRELEIANSRLKASEERLRAIFDGTNTLIGLLDTEGRIHSVNRAALDMVGISHEDALGRSFLDSPWWSHSERTKEQIREALERARRGDSTFIETTHRTVNGDLREIDFSMTPIVDEEGQPRWLIPEGRDVTELRLAQRAQKHLEARLQHVDRLESLGRLASGVAHDFNNLLTAIGGNVELLRLDTAPGEEAGELLNSISYAVESAASLTRQLLAFGRHHPRKSAALDLDGHLRQSLGMLRRLLPASTQIAERFEATGVVVQLDAGQLDQIVVNLVVNAQQAMPDGGTITLQTELRELESPPAGSVDCLAIHGLHAVLTVADEGCGIGAELLPRIFEPFVTTKTSGTGLGLSTVYGLVKQVGGCLGVEPRPAGGTRFSAYLPLAEPAEATDERGAGQRAIQGATVLLVDDDPAVLKVGQRLLESLHCDVTALTSGELALAALRRAPNRPEVLVTDVRMPHMTGPELARRARAERPQLGVVFVSANTTEEEIAAWLMDGRAVLVPKPFNARELADAIAGQRPAGVPQVASQPAPSSSRGG